MKNHIIWIVFTLSIVLVFTHCKKENENNEEVIPTERIYVGSLVNPSSNELQQFYEGKYTIIKGDVEFQNIEGLKNLIALSYVEKIEGSLSLLSNPDLESLEGLGNLTSIGEDFIIYGGNFNVLQNIDHLSNLKSIGQNLQIIYMNNIESLNGLSNLEKVGGEIKLFGLSKVNDLSSFNKIESITGLSINELPKLESLTGLSNISSVSGNIGITNCVMLYDYCPIKSLLSDGGLIGEFGTYGNLYNPSIEDITEGECSNDNPVIILDGIYIIGAGTAITDFDSKGMMRITRNEVTQENRPELLELYIAVKGGTEGFNIITVDGNTYTTYGPGADFAEVTELDGDEPTLGIQRGAVAETSAKFTVATDGLYHIAYDTEIGIVTIAKVEWGIIGAATPGGWGVSTQLTTGAFNLYSMTFSLHDLILTNGDYKIRYSNGWKVILDANFDLGNGNTGIKVNANYGGEIDALVPGGDNLVNDDPGYYTATMTWTLNSGTTAILEKTGDLQSADYSATELGFIGDGVIIAGTVVGWDATALNHIPVISNETIYTWNYTAVEFTTDGSFKIREGQDWNEMIIGYPDVVMGGSAAGEFETNGDGNFVPNVDGIYDIEFIIDAVTDVYTFNVQATGATDPELFVLGDGCAASWDNTAALPFNSETSGVYTLTTNLTGDGYIKFITTLGEWAPMYGTDADGTFAAGNLVYRESDTDPDPASIYVEADGSYTITVNTNDMTYTIVAAK